MAGTNPNSQDYYRRKEDDPQLAHGSTNPGSMDYWRRASVDGAFVGSLSGPAIAGPSAGLLLLGVGH